MNPSTALDSFQQTTLVLLPEIILLLCAIAIMTASAFVSRPRANWCAAAAAALGLALVVLLVNSDRETSLYSSVALNDSLSFLARIVLLLSGLCVLALAHQEPSDGQAGEFFGALLITTAGAMLVAAANELVFLFVGLELVSIPTYLLLYLSRRNRSTQEAATKYFYLSIFSSGLMLYGLALLYGTTGLGNLKAIAVMFERMIHLPQAQLGLLAVVFVLFGLCFRVTAVPLHFYAPDVYQGSPTVVAALLSWVPKAVGFLAIIRTLTAVLAGQEPGDPLIHKVIMLSWVIAAATMVWGGFVGLLQTNLRRLMAYSSISHAGYMMIGVTAAFANDHQGGGLYRGSESVVFYLVSYALMTLGTFAGLSLLRIQGRPVETIDDLAGLGWTHPLPAFGLSICLLSLTGIPPLPGFWAKFQVLAALLAAGQDDLGAFMLLAVIAVLSAAAAAYYYLRLVVAMYLRSATAEVEVGGGWPVACAATACAGLTLIVGLYSSPLSHAARAAADSALAHPSPSAPNVMTARSDVATPTLSH
jgi:NADH-quinone oxidoreductase subunit N